VNNSTQPRQATKNLFRTALLEALCILVIAAAAGFLFTGLTGRGFFRHTVGMPLPALSETPASPFLTFEEAQSLHNHHQTIFIDSRYAYDFALGHIKGAINIPLHEFDTAQPILSSLSRDQVLVTYCDGEECSSSIELAKLLYASGFVNVKVFFGGWNEWRTHDQPTEP